MWQRRQNCWPTSPREVLGLGGRRAKRRWSGNRALGAGTRPPHTCPLFSTRPPARWTLIPRCEGVRGRKPKPGEGGAAGTAEETRVQVPLGSDAGGVPSLLHPRPPPGGSASPLPGGPRDGGAGRQQGGAPAPRPSACSARPRTAPASGRGDAPGARGQRLVGAEPRERRGRGLRRPAGRSGGLFLPFSRGFFFSLLKITPLLTLHVGGARSDPKVLTQGFYL